MRNMLKHVALQHFPQPRPALQKGDLKDQPGKGLAQRYLNADSAKVPGSSIHFLCALS